MKSLHEIMFPSLKGKWGGIDLNECVKSFGVDASEPNPLLDPVVQGEYLSQMHQKMRVDYSYGGYLEDRSTLWRGHYMSPDTMVHLGIDYNVPVGTEVCLPHGGDIVYIGMEDIDNGGWGGRMDFKSRTLPVYFIIGHLDPDSILQFHPSKKQRRWFGGYPQHHVLALVGDSGFNGGWFPHIHLQCVAKEEYESHIDPMEIDGYGKMTDTLRTKFPDPNLLLRVDQV